MLRAYYFSAKQLVLKGLRACLDFFANVFYFWLANMNDNYRSPAIISTPAMTGFPQYFDQNCFTAVTYYLVTKLDHYGAFFFCYLFIISLEAFTDAEKYDMYDGSASLK